MSYENAPATKILATHCACCRRPLVDATSVEVGIGPDCRKKYGYDKPEGDAVWNAVETLIGTMHLIPDNAVNAIVARDARKLCNVLVNACVTTLAVEDIVTAAKVMSAAGYRKLAGKIARKLARTSVAVTVVSNENAFEVKTPFSRAFNDATRSVAGRRWNPETKSWLFPLAAKRAAWELLRSHFMGCTLTSAKGTTVIA